MSSYRLVFILAVGALTTVQASAADFPQRIPAPAPFVAPPIFTWTGVYAGAHLSYARQLFSKPTKDRNSIVAGLQLGANYQVGSMVFGAELEGGHLGVRHSKSATLKEISVEQKWLLAAKGRAGAAFDRTLVYGTAGLAMMELGARGPIGRPTGNKWRTGYVVGAGIEHAITDNLSLKGEYNYVRLARDYKIGKDKIDVTDHIVKAGINYRF